jgi:transcriptional regulator GlxA family with amidase domain
MAATNLGSDQDQLAKARALIRDSTASLAEIAHTCGFSSQAHLHSF